MYYWSNGCYDVSRYWLCLVFLGSERTPPFGVANSVCDCRGGRGDTYARKKGLKYLPDTQTDKEPKDTLKFMESFISTGTSATIVSNRVSWLAGDDKLISILQSKIEKGTRIEIITPNEVPEALKEKLNGASFIVTRENVSPEARFTLVNGDRSGAEKLAIARGVHPDHEITIFDNNSGPQIIAMAKDIIRKSKELVNAA